MTVSEENLEQLRQSHGGNVLTPGDNSYSAARRCFNALVDRRPAVIAQCLGAADIATAFDFARAHELAIAVRGGGHNPAGHCVVDDGLVIDLSALRAVQVDAGARVARAEGGAMWLDFDSATQAFGLVTPGGVVGSTGVCGLTLGGGIGHLTAQYGLTCDNLVGAELVTPEGSFVRVSADENAELLWALRGGGGNFGVATCLEFRLHPLDRVVGGRLEWRGDAVRDALRVFRDVAEGSPRQLSCQAVIGVDEAGSLVFAAFPCSVGSESASVTLDALRSAPGCVVDTVGERTFLDQQLLLDSPYGENRHYWKGHFVGGLPDELIDELVDRIGAFGSPLTHLLIESLHGAPTDADRASSALAYRDAAFNISAMAVWRSSEQDASHIAWARETAAAVEPWSFGGGYANYMQADEPIERVRASFGDASFERLRALKSLYDPTNALRRNQNIPPRGL